MVTKISHVILKCSEDIAFLREKKKEKPFIYQTQAPLTHIKVSFVEFTWGLQSISTY